MSAGALHPGRRVMETYAVSPLLTFPKYHRHATARVAVRPKARTAAS